ncbi:MAG: cache domain-containing protein [Treponema sp.]|jgi:methyl-accepting chemotaxis protein|nr:cache domain-containing protein [Treponema sp.]
MKLSVKMPLLIGTAILVVSAGIGLSAILVSSKIVEETARLSLINQAVQGAELVELELHTRLVVLQEITNREAIKSMDWERQRAILLLEVDREGYLDLAIVDMQGQARYIKDNIISNLAERDYIIKALAGGQAVSDVLISKVINKPVVMYAVPIMDAAGVVAGALIGRKDGTALNQVTKNVKLGSTGYSYMTNRDGIIISHEDIDMVLNQYNPIVEAEKDPSVQSLADTIADSLREIMGFRQYMFKSKEMVAGVEQINMSVDCANGISLKNRENVGDLVKAVSRFQV